MDMYYYVPARQYIYLHGGRWIRSTYVPVHYRHIDFYRTYKVVINDRDPFRYHNRYRVQYAKYRHRYDQPVLRDVRYRESNRGNNGWNNDRNRGNDRWDNDRNRNNERWNNDRNRGNERWSNDRKDNNRGNDKWNNNNRGNGRSDGKRGNSGWNNGHGNEKREKDNRGNGRGRS
jgi:hypothetical protein